MIKTSEEFFRLTEEISALKQERKYSECLEKISDYLHDTYLLSFPVLMSNEDISATVLFSIPLERDKWAEIAELSAEAGDVYNLMNEENTARPFFILALEILTELVKKEKATFTIYYHSLIREIFARVVIFELPLNIQIKLLWYFFDNGRYAAADDIFFNILDRHDDVTFILDIGIPIYETLLKKSKAQLEKGNLIKSEVKESMQRIRQIQKNLFELRESEEPE